MDQDVDTSELVAKGALGRRDQKSGLYEVADYRVGGGGGEDDSENGEAEDEEGDEDQDEKPASSTAAAAAASSGGALSSFFSKLSLSSRDRALTAEDLAPTIAAMQQHLMAKNVARDIAEQIVANVGKSLEGKKIALGSGLLGLGGGDRAGKRAVRGAMQDALVKILTPKTSTDLLLEIQRKRSSSSSSSTAAGGGGDPYAITFVGVNGVGKSTNLSKVAFWLLQNRLRVLIAACDTFRSGAVEQLRVHVRNLSKLEEELGGGGMQDGKSRVELFEKGYGKDAAGIAKDAIAHGKSGCFPWGLSCVLSPILGGRVPLEHEPLTDGLFSLRGLAAKQNGFDVVLIDTAGRMQDNEPLMRALAKVRFEYHRTFAHEHVCTGRLTDTLPVAHVHASVSFADPRTHDLHTYTSTRSSSP